jgi:hypothetical protein
LFCPLCYYLLPDCFVKRSLIRTLVSFVLLMLENEIGVGNVLYIFKRFGKLGVLKASQKIVSALFLLLNFRILLSVIFGLNSSPKISSFSATCTFKTLSYISGACLKKCAKFATFLVKTLISPCKEVPLSNFVFSWHLCYFFLVLLGYFSDLHF